MSNANQPATNETRLAYCAQGAKVIEAALKQAEDADTANAPAHLTADQAAIWNQARASAYQHALEMMAPVSAETSEELLQRTIETSKAALARTA